MLLYNNNNNNNDGNTNTTQPQQQRCVEQWSLQRTAGQFQSVANELFQQCHEDHRTLNIAIGGDGKNTDDHILRKLPTWSRRPTIAEVDQSLSIVDSILRGWILSPQCVNTPALKQFLGLQNINDNKLTVNSNNNNNKNNNNKTTSESVGAALFQSLYRHVHCTNPLVIHNHIMTIVPNHITSDVYVREWLQSVRRTGIQQRASSCASSIVMKNQNHHNKNLNSGTTTIGLLSLLFKTKLTNTNISQIAIQLHHHQYHERNMLYFGGAAVAVIGIVPTVLPLWKYIMPVMQIRLDYLFASWIGATYLGHAMGTASKSTRPDRAGGTSTNHPRLGATMSSLRHKKISTTHAAAPSSSSSTSLKSITIGTVNQQQQQQQVPDSPKATSSSDNSVVMVTDYVDAVHSSDMDDFVDFHPSSSEPYYHHLHHPNVTDEGNDEDNDDDDESDGEATTLASDDLLQRPASDNYLSSLSNDKTGFDNGDYLSSPLPKYPNNNGSSCWSQPSHDIFHVRGATYLRDKVKICSGPSPLTCRGVDVWITDNPERHIARHPSILGGQLNDVDTFLVNFLLPFGNFSKRIKDFPLNNL